MTLTEAQKVGMTKLLKGTSIVLAILFALLLIGETKGDFANGVLFFLEAVLSVNTALILTILFGLTYFFSRKAVKEILIEKRNTLLVTIKYATLISLALCIYGLTVFFFKLDDISYGGLEKTLKLHFLGMFFKTAFFICIVWLWWTNKVKSMILTHDVEAQ